MFGWNRSSNTPKNSSKEIKGLIGLQEIKGCNNPDRNGDVIFVHGLGGNLRSTWHPEELQDDNFWLNWLSQDNADIGIWSFGYKAEPFEWRGNAMPLFDQASNLLEWLETKGLSERPIIFVTHSLGGLLVKKMLNTAQTFKKQKLIEQIKGIVFLATPHTGSHLANLINNIGALARTTISVEELKAHSPQLRELNEWYRENVRSFGIATKVYYETVSVHGVPVVDEDSANPGIEGVKPIAVPENHITIAKPSSRNDLVYIGVERFILGCFKPSHDNGESDIALSISIANDFTEESFTGGHFRCGAPERTLKYEISQVTEQIQITPQMEYLKNLENGVPIKDLGMVLDIPPYFKWQFPNLDLRIVNNSNKTVYITDIFIEVEKSSLDPYPVLVIPGEEPNALHVLLVNDGWGEVQNAIVRFNLIPKGYPITFDGVYNHEISIGNFIDAYNLDLSDALQSIGVDVGFINGFNSYEEQYQSIHKKMGRFLSSFKEFIKSKNDEDYKRLVNALGVFQYSDTQSRTPFPAVVYGEISFTGRTVEQELKSNTIKFSSEFTLLIPGGYGAPGGPSYQYAAKLDTDREKYQVRIQGNGSSVSQYLKSGDVDRFNVRVGVLKSSLHKFCIRLVYNDNQSILSSPIYLKIFVPKSEADSIRGMDALRVEQGRRLAGGGDVDGAISKFNEALKYNPDLNLEPLRESQKLAAPSFIEKGNECLKNGKLKESVEFYVKAKQFDRALEVSAYSWNIEQVEGVNERLSIANSLCRNLVSVDDHRITWQPQGDIPNILEVLIWLWVVCPSAWQTITISAPQELRNAIIYYNSQQHNG
jgi:predicted alpha/beta hydrolase family esterase/tetratricopeptide (TPR) repeat protein